VAGLRDERSGLNALLGVEFGVMNTRAWIRRGWSLVPALSSDGTMDNGSAWDDDRPPYQATMSFDDWVAEQGGTPSGGRPIRSRQSRRVSTRAVRALS
jgi:hypothetical protein